jgi:hypothetical protein
MLPTNQSSQVAIAGFRSIKDGLAGGSTIN